MLLSAHIEKRFESGVQVSATLAVPADASVTILFGPSGAGKTTVLRAIAGLETLSAGHISFKGRDWTKLPPQRRPIGYVFQEYALFSHLTVRDNIAFGIRKASDRELRVLNVAKTAHVTELLNRRPSELSGGQQQRVALARALAREPELLLLDEPLSALDGPTRNIVRGELSGLLGNLGIPAIVVTHDWEDALSWGQHLIVMKNGIVLQSGRPQDVFTRPGNPDVAAVVGVETVVPATVKERQPGLAVLKVGTAEVYGADPGDSQTDYFACIRGENVILQTAPPGQSSARNHIKGRVIEITPLGALFRITIDAGFNLVALVTGQAVTDLELTRNSDVYAIFKASAVHLIPRV